jgi:hypothetical protein
MGYETGGDTYGTSLCKEFGTFKTDLNHTGIEETWISSYLEPSSLGKF